MRLRETLGRYRDGLTLAALVVASLVSLAVSTDSLSLRPSEVGQSVLALLQHGASAVGTFLSRTVTSVRELASLRREHAALLETLEEYQTIRGDLELLQSENERLKDLLAFGEAVAVRNLPARVIAKEPGQFFQGLTINKGRAAGVLPNMPVIASQNGVVGLVGRISESGLTSSIVMPLFDANSYVAGRLQKSRHEGLVGGEGADEGRLVMRYVTKSAREQVAVGDVVITSGMRSLYPEGIRIGTVESIQGRAWETSLLLLLTPTIDFGRLEYVLVLTERE